MGKGGRREEEEEKEKEGRLCGCVVEGGVRWMSEGCVAVWWRTLKVVRRLFSDLDYFAVVVKVRI